jgi:hypothetical protein
MQTMRHRVLETTACLAALLLALAACGGDPAATDQTPPPDGGQTEDGEAEPTETDPDEDEVGGGAIDVCRPLLATSATVGAVFGGVVSAQFDSQTFTEMAGEVRRCMYTLEGASTSFVEVDYLGAADAWPGVREGYDEFRGPLIDVDGIGDEAFHPTGRQHLVVLAGDVVFSVDTFEMEGSEEEVLELARRIAADAQ